MNHNSRFVVDMQVTGKCNLTCDFCDGAPKEYAGVPFDNILAGIDKLVEAGLTTLNVSGGEPLVRKDTPKILAYARGKGLEVYLSTNGFLLDRFFDEVAPHITTLGLPLDGSTPEVNASMTRGNEQFDITLSFLRKFKTDIPHFTVKVGTVISAINIHDIPNIATVLFDNASIYPPDVWRVYEFTPLGDGYFSKHRHTIMTEEFERVVNHVRGIYPNRVISPLSNADSNDSYIFIDPRLMVQIYTNDNYYTVGNLIDLSIKDIINLKNDYSAVISKGGNNRIWLSTRGT